MNNAPNMEAVDRDGTLAGHSAAEANGSLPLLDPLSLASGDISSALSPENGAHDNGTSCPTHNGTVLPAGDESTDKYGVNRPQWAVVVASEGEVNDVATAASGNGKAVPLPLEVTTVFDPNLNYEDGPHNPDRVKNREQLELHLRNLAAAGRFRELIDIVVHLNPDGKRNISWSVPVPEASDAWPELPIAAAVETTTGFVASDALTLPLGIGEAAQTQLVLSPLYVELDIARELVRRMEAARMPVSKELYSLIGGDRTHAEGELRAVIQDELAFVDRELAARERRALIAGAAGTLSAANVLRQAGRAAGTVMQAASGVRQSIAGRLRIAPSAPPESAAAEAVPVRTRNNVARKLGHITGQLLNLGRSS